MTQIKKLKSNLYIQYMIVFAVIAFFIFAVVPATKSTLIWNSDGITQHYPALVYWHDMLRKLLFHHQLWTQWDWNIGLGQDTIQTFSYYVMGDIFTYPSVFFHTSQLATYYSVMVIVRLFLIGISFVFVARRLTHFHHNWTILTASIVYVFSGYSAYVTFAHPFFLNPLIIFPLLILAVITAQKGGRISPLIIMTAWTLFNSFYLGAVMGMGTVIYYLISLITTKSFRTIKLNLKLIAGVIVGCLLSAVLFLPSLFQMINSARSTTTIANGLKIYPLAYYLSLPGLTISNHLRPYWITGAILTIGVIAVIWSLRRFKKYLLINLVILTGIVFVLSPILAAILNGGTSPSNRFTFMLMLPIALATVNLLEHLSQLTVKDFVIFFCCELIITASLYLAHNFSFKFDLGAVLVAYTGLILLMVLYRYFGSNQHVSRMIILGMVVLVSWNAISIMRDRHANQFDVDTSMLMSAQSVAKLTTAQQAYLDNQTSSTKHHRSLIDNQLNNYTDKSPADNLPILAKTFNINSYWSLQNGYLGQLNDALENNTSNPNDVTNNADFRNAILKFLGVSRVFINPDNPLIPTGFDDQYQQINGQRLLSSNTTMPLIYESTGNMTNQQFNALDPNQKELALINNTISSKKSTTTGADRTLVKKAKLIKFDNLPAKNVTSQHISIETPNINYNPTLLTMLDSSDYKGYELHARLNHVHYSAGKLKDRYKLATDNYIDQHNEKIMNENDDSDLRYNSSLYKLNWLRQNVMSISSDTGEFNIGLKYNGTENIFAQEGQDNLSFYHPRFATTLNLGTIKKNHQDVKISLPTQGKYTFDISLWAVPSGKIIDRSIQKNKAATHIRYHRNQVTAQFDATHNTTLATTIPYSSGWHLSGSNKKLPRVNKAFIGIPVKQGQNHIKLLYRSPLLQVGKIASLIGLISLLIIMVWESKKRRSH